MMLSELPDELLDLICAEVAGRNRNATRFGFASLTNMRLVNKTISAVASSKMFSFCRFAMNPQEDRYLKNFARTGLGPLLRVLTIRPARRLVGNGPLHWEDDLFHDWPENLAQALSAFSNITTLKLSGMRSQAQGYCMQPLAMMWTRALIAVALPNLRELKLCSEFADRLDDRLRSWNAAGPSISLLQQTLGQIRELTLVNFGSADWDALAGTLTRLRHLKLKRGLLSIQFPANFLRAIPAETLLTLSLKMTTIRTGIFIRMLESQASSLRGLELNQWRLDEGTVEELSDYVVSHCRRLIMARIKGLCSYVKFRESHQRLKDHAALDRLGHHLNAVRQQEGLVMLVNRKPRRHNLR